MRVISVIYGCARNLTTLKGWDIPTWFQMELGAGGTTVAVISLATGGLPRTVEQVDVPSTEGAGRPSPDAKETPFHLWVKGMWLQQNGTYSTAALNIVSVAQKPTF